MFLLSDYPRRMLAFSRFSFAGLDPIVHDLALAEKRAGVRMVPPRANLPWHYKRPLVCQTDRNKR
jgi:hypothetical protein